jgi:hypothetical protein
VAKNRFHTNSPADLAAVRTALRRLELVLDDAVVYDDGASVSATGAWFVSAIAATTLSISGVATFKSAVSVAGTVTLGSTLTVSGATTLQGVVSAAGAVTFGSTLSVSSTVTVLGEVRVAGDVGGVANKNTLTGTSDLTANSTGVGTIKFKGTTSRDSSGFIKFYIGTTAYYVPVFSAITG